jgi:3-oxoacyl-[acyl-carrier protein] reductase
MSKLTAKVAVVTGASKGIGAAIAKSFAAEGASVVVNYASSKAGADTVVAAITAAGGKAGAVRGDVSKAAEAKAIIEAAINKNINACSMTPRSQSLSSGQATKNTREAFALGC